MLKFANEIWRNYVTDGVPSSGQWPPKKSEIREWGAYIEALHLGSGLAFKFSSSTTDADPGQGLFRINGTSADEATAIFFDDIDLTGVTIGSVIDTWDDSTNSVRGLLTVRGISDTAVMHAFEVGGSVVDGSGYRKVTVAYVGGFGAFAADDLYAFVFNRAGDSATPVVTTIAALKALDTSRVLTAYQVGSGFFEWTLGDFTSRVAADTSGSIYVPADDVAVSVGVWVKANAGLYSLAGQGALTYVSYFSNPSAIGDRHYAIAGQLSAGTAAAGDKVGVYGGAESGPSGSSNVWGGNFLAQWNTGHPDVHVQAVEIDFNNLNADVPHNPPKLKTALSLASGGTKIAGYALYIDASNKPTNAWRQGIAIQDGGVLDSGVNVGMLSSSATYCGRQIANNGDTLLLQRRTDVAPTGFYARFFDAALAASIWTVDINGATSIGPRAASVAGTRLHVSEADNTNATEVLSLGLEGTSSANSTGKIVTAAFFGRDTTIARKQTAAIKAIPLDGNWVNSALGVFIRVADALVEVARFGSKQMFSLSGSLGRGVPVTKTADFTVADTENWLNNNKAGATCTVTLPAAVSYPGREIMIRNLQAFTVVSASANVVPLGGGAAATAILAATAGKWATLVSDGANWVVMQGN